MNQIEMMKQWAEGVSKAYELTAWGHTERAAEILRQTRDSIRTAIEAAEKQEPVAYSYTSRITGAQGFSHHPMPRFIDSESWDIKPLYTSPPASKPWAGLSTDEIYDMYNEPRSDAEMVEFARAIEANLKGKNT